MQQGSDADRAHRPAGRCARQPQAPRPQDSSTAVHFRENAVHFHEHAQTTALSYASANLDATVNARFQTYQAYAASPPTSTGFAAKYQQWSQDMQASVLTTLKAAQTQATQINGPEQQTVSRLQAQSTGAAGQLQALQTGNAIGLEAIAQVQKLRQLLLTDLQLKANASGASADKDAAQQAAWQAFAAKPSVTLGQGGARF